MKGGRLTEEDEEDDEANGEDGCFGIGGHTRQDSEEAGEVSARLRVPRQRLVHELGVRVRRQQLHEDRGAEESVHAGGDRQADVFEGLDAVAVGLGDVADLELHGAAGRGVAGGEARRCDSHGDRLAFPTGSRNFIGAAIRQAIGEQEAAEGAYQHPRISVSAKSVLLEDRCLTTARPLPRWRCHAPTRGAARASGGQCRDVAR